MTSDPRNGVSRRTFLISSGVVGAAAVAGCNNGSGSTGTETASGSSTLQAGGSSTVHPIASQASNYWNANRPASDSEYWPHGEYDIETDKNLADYWGGLYGFESSGDGDPPFNVSVALSHSGTGIEKCQSGQVDIGNASSGVRSEKPDWSTEEYDKFVDHVTGVDGQPLVVSASIRDEGVTEITGDELKDIYKGRIDNWSDLGGPDRDIQVLGRVKGSGTRTAFVSNVFGDSTASTTVDNRFGQNQQLAQAVSDSDNAIAYLALAFLDTEGVEDIGLEWDGTLYEKGADENSLAAKEYPLSRDLHMYTYDGTSEKEAAFLRMILSDFGQDTFVAPEDYFTLNKTRQENQLSKLPSPSGSTTSN